MKRPAFQFYVQDFMNGTMYMTAEQVGGYIRLLCHQWDKGSIPNNEELIITVSGVKKKNISAILEKFYLGDDNQYRNKKLELVRSNQEEYVRKQAENGAKGGRPKKPNPNPPVLKTETQTEPKKSSSTSTSTSSSNRVVDTTKSVWNIYNTVMANQIEYEQIVAACYKDKTTAEHSLMKYHLYMESNEKYPVSRKQAFSGFRLWLMNETGSGSLTTGEVKKMVM